MNHTLSPDDVQVDDGGEAELHGQAHFSMSTVSGVSSWVW